MNRTPPVEIRRALRHEVGFGCPVDGCDSPYLTWHHFDPPWAERQHHDPAGMVAMCIQHHGEADEGAFTKDQLRAMKDPARNRSAERVAGRFLWRRDRLVLLAGGNWWTECAVLLQVGPRPIIWLSRDGDGYELLNLDLFDDAGAPRLQLRDNDWIADREVDDLECKPRKASLAIKTAALGAELSISFQRAEAGTVRARALEVARASDREMDRRPMPQHVRQMLLQYRPRPEEVAERTAASVLAGLPEADSALCVIEGRLRWPVEIALEPTQLVLPGHNVLSGCLTRRCQVGIQIG